jgi:hypothetical protein
LTSYRARYPRHYDDVFDCIHRRLRDSGYATKLDLDGLIAWKHVRTARWMRDLNCITEARVKEITSDAFARATNAQRREALSPLPGFGAGTAFTSVLLAAWDPETYGVYDKFSLAARVSVVTAACSCSWYLLDTYEEHLRLMAYELADQTQTSWFPRHVDMALYEMGWEADIEARRDARRRSREEKRALRSPGLQAGRRAATL